MFRFSKAAVIALSLAAAVGCTNKKVSNPIANVDSKQPDKVLFDRAMDAMKHNKFDVARLTLQTLINTYPDSEFIARAKLSLADSWYDEGGTASLTEAENEYNDFKTFFPNLPEAAEAQLKIANIHYQQMEQPDRDYTHAKRAEEEYRNLISQFPDSKLVPEAKRRLLQVQEVIATREFQVGRFYFLKQSYPAAIARLQSLIDRYPLYSRADEALYMLGQSYEGEIAILRARAVPNEAAKARMIDDFTKNAAQAYSKILTRYPLMDRADDAKKRLADLKQPVPKPTKSAVAQNKAEIENRREANVLTKTVKTFAKHPDVSSASTKGEPTLVDPQPMSATDVVQRANKAAAGSDATKKGTTDQSLTVEAVGNGAPPPAEDQPAPRSDAPPSEGEAGAAAGGDPAAATKGPLDAGTPAASGTPAAEVKPDASAAPDPNELKPNVSQTDSSAPLPPPQQVNEIQGGASPSTGTASTAASDEPASDKDIASSKPKKKKGLEKLNPF